MSFSIYQLKPRFQQLLRPLLSRLAQWRVSPNQITLLAMAFYKAHEFYKTIREKIKVNAGGKWEDYKTVIESWTSSLDATMNSIEVLFIRKN